MNIHLQSFVQRYESLCITLVRVLLLCSFALFGFQGCKKNIINSPYISLSSDSGYVHKDSVMGIGDNFKVRLYANFGGEANITNIVIRNEHDGIITSYFDTGINNEAINISKILTKGIYDKETWTFMAIDKNGGNASVSFTLTKDPNSTFGNIKHINATMGAQASTLYGSFLSLNSGIAFFQDAAYLIQDTIEMLYYYDGVSGEANTIASPNANIGTTIYTGTTSPLNWSVKNETRYYKTTLSQADFNKASNDSLLLVSYSDINAKRKAKNLVDGDIYSFKTTHNKYGLFYVEHVEGMDTGYVNVNILIQP